MIRGDARDALLQLLDLLLRLRRLAQSGADHGELLVARRLILVAARRDADDRRDGGEHVVTLLVTGRAHVEDEVGLERRHRLVIHVGRAEDLRRLRVAVFYPGAHAVATEGEPVGRGDGLDAQR